MEHSSSSLVDSTLISSQRLSLVEFLIQSAEHLQVAPVVKYSALSLFADRFLPSLPRFKIDAHNSNNWLLNPLTESALHLFAVISLWISTKMHDSRRPLSVTCLRSLANKSISEQHFTTRNFLEAEVLFMQVLNFEIGTTNIAFLFLQELWIQIKGVAKAGELINFEACMEILDLLYEKEETSLLCTYSCPPHSLAASILVVTYVMTVPQHKWEFPILPWGEEMH
ncbi:cyclin-J18 isoform X2 [Arachis ipaensis]|uniref:cyclin-J18 isoform X2 n=1 Tax=Arachis ipaensis TaxID=130454 RepID=UPI0007AF1D4B|nr:cyclin-J18 isoform X2 [Arachis ipaensis]